MPPARLKTARTVTGGQCWQNYSTEEWLLWQTPHVVMLILNSSRTNVHFSSCHCHFAMQATSKKRKEPCAVYAAFSACLWASIRQCHHACRFVNLLAEGKQKFMLSYLVLVISLSMDFFSPILLCIYIFFLLNIIQ